MKIKPRPRANSLKRTQSAKIRRTSAKVPEKEEQNPAKTLHEENKSKDLIPKKFVVEFLKQTESVYKQFYIEINSDCDEIKKRIESIEKQIEEMEK